jgi:hypothetical protein
LRNQAVYKVATSLANSRWVAKGLYDRAVEALGHVGITDVICLCKSRSSEGGRLCVSRFIFFSHSDCLQRPNEGNPR